MNELKLKEILLLEKIAKTQKLKDKKDIYYDNLETLKDYDILVCDEKANDNISKFLGQFNSSLSHLGTMLTSNNTYIINKHTITNEKNYIKYFYNIYFDTNIVSYLEDNRYQKIKNPKLIKEIRSFQIKRKYQSMVNFTPYILENALLSNMNEKISANIYSFLYFFYKPCYFRKSKVREVTEKHVTELNKKFTEILELMRSKYIDMYYLIYVNLLNACLIKLNGKKDEFKKWHDFLLFCDQKIFILYTPVLNFIYHWLTNKTKLNILNKIQKGSKGLLTNLKNITWDIFHIINMRESFHKQKCENTVEFDVVIPMFFSADKNLNEIRGLFSVFMVATKPGEEPHLFYRNDYYQSPTFKNLYQFFTIESSRRRGKSYNTDTIKKVIEELEKEIEIL